MTPAELRAHGERMASRPEWGENPPLWHTAATEADWMAEAALVEAEANQQFIESKKRRAFDCGFEADHLNDKLFDWQSRIVSWACRKGRAAVFADCGLGKTPMQLDWADNVASKTGLPVLIVAPLAVAAQTVREGRKFGVRADEVRTAEQAQAALTDGAGILVTNYERIDKFADIRFGGIVLDESSILKAVDGKTRAALTEFASEIQYRLCCTATPSPNDYMELGNHAEFLGVSTMPEMLATIFVHDCG
jgi:SNF2 family DNA or RNA helicase